MIENCRVNDCQKRELVAEIAEWKQAASVEAGLRREFLARAELAETKLANAITVVRAEECPFKDGQMADAWADAWATFLNRLGDIDGTNELFANSHPVGTPAND